MRRIWIGAGVTAILALPALALEPERREVIVTSNRVWDGYVYQENFVPSALPAMALLADKDNAVSFVKTQEYYWPLSRQTYVDFDREKDPVPGSLQITQGGKLVTEVAVAPYVMVYPKGAANGEGYLLWGDAALAAYDQYREGEQAFAVAFSASQQAEADYERRLKEAAIARLAGKGVQEVPPPPPAPVPNLKLVTQPVPGLQVNLPVGDYQMQLVAAGLPVPGTARALHVTKAAERDVITADIIPEERWTRPLSANDPGEKIYARPGTTFYMTLAYASRFDAQAYLGIVQPQAEAVAGRQIWVRRRSADARVVRFGWDNAAPMQDLTLTALKVQQTEGAGFGYVVRPAKAAEQPDLTAFAVSVPQDAALTRGALGAEDTTGAALSRQVVVVQPRREGLAWALALLPALAGFALMLYRRRALA